MTFDELQQQKLLNRPHVVLLGAGASLQAFPGGDRNGYKLPLMCNLVETLGLESLLEQAGLDRTGENFEVVYAQIATDPSFSEVRRLLEDAISQYFSKLELPDQPTIYDYLVHSLREKDAIATFNWDPFLFLAAHRNHNKTKLPKLFYLHGCSMIGYCQNHKSQGRIWSPCPKCGQIYSPMQLLYPIANKDYTKDPYIASQWESLKMAIQKAFILTIFGYAAPESDVAAREIMLEAWGETEGRDLEQIEFIDIKGEDELIETWEPFIHTHHYQSPVKSYYESLLGMFPRRTCEAMWAQNMDCAFLDYAHRVPMFRTLDELSAWFDLVRSHEENP